MPSKQNASLTLIKYPIMTEKSKRLAREINKYCFVVDKKANKSQIKVGIEELFDVKVSGVNTTILPRKRRSTKKSILQNQTRYKRAIVTLTPGSVIKIFDQN